MKTLALFPFRPGSGGDHPAGQYWPWLQIQYQQKHLIISRLNRRLIQLKLEITGNTWSICVRVPK